MMAILNVDDVLYRYAKGDRVNVEGRKSRD